MPVPKRKISRARRNKRSANKGVCLGNVVTCQTCQAAILPHQVCKECGHYKGIKIIRTKADRMYERSQARQTQQSTERQKPNTPSETQE
ncbi:50S ribosomal protein L32 [Candidatus Dependentiae bacterium]|nr:50S ribosomal protein L32 [Candidatus Dependentiae bacterium]